MKSANVKTIEIKDYDYALPDERIAKYPLPERDQSRMLVYDGATIADEVFCNIARHLPADELVVMNNTRVIRARLFFRKETGALIEIFCLEPEQPRDYAQMFQTRNSCVWQCMVGNLKKWKQGALHLQCSPSLTLTAEIMGEVKDAVLIRFSWDGEADFSQVLEQAGQLPIPPYLNRDTEDADLVTYQTVYSSIKGSVAAPTAGLHFTPQVLAALDSKGIEREEVTLHVGAGTFRPVKAANIGGHDMHAEHIVVTQHTIERLIAHGAHCTAIGTTSVRTLESLYYIGAMLLNHTLDEHQAIHVPQWIAYDTTLTIRPTAIDALQAILDYLQRNHLTALHASTRIIIAPGYRYHIVHRMLTNFHQPQSTLLLLVSAFIGDDWRTIYRHALDHDYRFLSYGDCCLLTKRQK